MSSYYSFGEKSAALIGVLLTSDGKVTAFACQRPNFIPPVPAMQPLFTSQPLALTQAGLVPFRLTLAATKVGLLALEPRGWTKAYESQRVHFLGMLNPFGIDEIPYANFGGANRSGGIPANRVFDGVFSYNPAAVDPNQKASVTLKDVESGGEGEETVSISSFDDSTNLIHGGIFVTIRVNDANRGNACATLEFTGGHAVQMPNAAGVYQAQSKLVLNC